MKRNHIEEGVYVGDTAGDYYSATEAGNPCPVSAYAVTANPGT